MATYIMKVSFISTMFFFEKAIFNNVCNILALKRLVLYNIHDYKYL